MCWSQGNGKHIFSKTKRDNNKGRELLLLMPPKAGLFCSFCYLAYRPVRVCSQKNGDFFTFLGMLNSYKQLFPHNLGDMETGFFLALLNTAMGTQYSVTWLLYCLFLKCVYCALQNRVLFLTIITFCCLKSNFKPISFWKIKMVEIKSQ